MAKPPAPKHQPESVDKAAHSDGVLTPLEAEIDRQIGSIVPQNVRTQVVERVTTIMASESFSGPIAHPRHLREYEEVCPGAATRIIGMAEDRNRHIMKMEEIALTESVKDQKRGLLYGLIAFVLLIAAGFVCAMTNNNTGAGWFLSAATLGGIGLFIRERKEK